MLLLGFLLALFIYRFNENDATLEHFALLQSDGASSSGAYDYSLAIPQGTTPNLPSIRVDDSKVETSRTTAHVVYGGKGDKVHLGGFTDIDLQGISPAVWKAMVQDYGIKTLIDLGCGRGISTSWFLTHGVDATCVEGSHDAVLQTMMPIERVIEHDFSRGPWWPAKTQDAVWCVEFLEHVGVNFHQNYLPVFRKSALIFATHSNWGGWHHVEVHTTKWWIRKMQMYGFQYSEEMSLEIQGIASKEQENKTASIIVEDEPYNAQHIWTTMMVFINPAVSALPEHAHLFSGIGCFQSLGGEKGIVNKDCDGENESKLPPEYYPLVLTEQQDEDWVALVKKNIAIKQSE